MNRFSITALLLLAVIALPSCKDDILEEGSYPENVVSFMIGNDATATKASASSVETQVASYTIEGVEDNDLVLIETVTSADNLYSTDLVETKGTPVYTENFDALYGEQVYATAFEPKSGAASAYAPKDVWGSYLENGGTVKYKNTAAHTYSYDYSKGQKVNLSWPAGGRLLYFIQAPYSTTNALNPDFYSDGSIQFDYTDPTATTTVGGRPTIVNGATNQKDILFTSKEISKPATGGNQNNILMYHALTAVKFKVGNVDEGIETVINSITLKGITANGHCTIVPNYGDSNTSAGDNPSNAGGAEATKSYKCATWTDLASPLVVDYTQNFNGKTDYTTENSNFGDSFYAGTTDEKNLVTADGSEVLLMVPQTLNNVEIVVDFSLKAKKTGVLVGTYSRSVKLSSTWKAGELHTYTLTVNKVSVSVTDSMDNNKEVKSALSTSNSGNVTAYLRATYAIAWYYGYGDDAICVASWHGHGKFTYLGGPDDQNGYKNTWMKGSDGYYYYVNPVLPGRPTQFPLFTTFSAASITEEPVFPNSHLEMKILLQGVQFDESKQKVTAAWGDIDEVDADGNPTGKKIVDLLSTKPENIDL